MTTSQKLAIRSSEIRQRLNEIAGLETDKVTDAIRAESDTLRAELNTVESQHRAALASEGDDEARAAGGFDNGDGEPAEVRALLGRVGIGDYLRPAAAGIGLSGAPVELAGALKVTAVGPSGGVAVPWTVLAGPEHRSAPERRAFTTDRAKRRAAGAAADPAASFRHGHHGYARRADRFGAHWHF